MSSNRRSTAKNEQKSCDDVAPEDVTTPEVNVGGALNLAEELFKIARGEPSSSSSRREEDTLPESSGRAGPSRPPVPIQPRIYRTQQPSTSQPSAPEAHRQLLHALGSSRSMPSRYLMAPAKPRPPKTTKTAKGSTKRPVLEIPKRKRDIEDTLNVLRGRPPVAMEARLGLSHRGAEPRSTVEANKDMSNHTVLMGSMVKNCMDRLQAQKSEDYAKFSEELVALVNKYNL